MAEYCLIHHRPVGKARMRRIGLWLCAATASGCPPTAQVEGFPDAYIGVGVELTMRDDYPVVVRPLIGGAAADAGVRAGDKIIAVNGVHTYGRSLGEVVVLLRGPPATEVVFSIERGPVELSLTLSRRPMARHDDDYHAQPAER